MTALAENNRARFDYEIIQTLTTGMVLRGFEVKAIRASRMNLAGSFGQIRGGKLWLLNADIPPFQPANTPDGYDQKRTRELLVNKKELLEIARELKSSHLTLVPLKVYDSHGVLKLELALARPKKKGDKREAIRKKETKREINRSLRSDK